MSDWMKVWNKVSESLRFFWTKTSGTPWHVKVFIECALLNVPEDLMRRTLIWLAEHGLVTLTTWSRALRREAHYWEFRSLDDFFYNRDDSNYVRVKPLVSF